MYPYTSESQNSPIDPEERAAKILATTWNGSLPVRSRTIASRIGVIVTFLVGMGAVTAKYEAIHSTGAVELNAESSRERQNFALAHALAHHLNRIGTHVDTPLSYEKSGNAGEVYANRFAMALLMPREPVLGMIADGADAARIAEAFEVPRPIAEARIAGLVG